jgi:hypothetical protein
MKKITMQENTITEILDMLQILMAGQSSAPSPTYVPSFQLSEYQLGEFKSSKVNCEISINFEKS